MTDQKVAVISGGMGGVGRATARALAAQQYRVVILYRHSSDEEIVEVQNSLSKGKHLFVRCDVSNGHEVARVVHEIFLKTDRIDVAIHTAVDPIERKRIVDMDEKTFRGQFETGFFGAFNLFQSVAKIMKKQGSGTCIGITSTAIESNTTTARMGAYTVAKISLRGLLRELHRELSSNVIGVFAIAPGLMQTSLNADLPDKFFEMAVEHNGEALTTPELVAETIVRLCSDSTITAGVSSGVPLGKMTPL